jgi:vacuolar-type H+-ATPase subunit F/Vma7
MTPYVLGEEEVVLGFALIGIAGYVPADRNDALDAFASVRGSKSVLILVTQAVAAWIEAQIEQAILGGIMVQVIPGVRAVAGRRQEAEALLLSALGIKL